MRRMDWKNPVFASRFQSLSVELKLSILGTERVNLSKTDRNWFSAVIQLPVISCLQTSIRCEQVAVRTVSVAFLLITQHYWYSPRSKANKTRRQPRVSTNLCWKKNILYHFMFSCHQIPCLCEFMFAWERAGAHFLYHILFMYEFGPCTNITANKWMFFNYIVNALYGRKFNYSDDKIVIQMVQKFWRPP